MALSDLAQRVYDALPEDGSKLGGITIQNDLGITKTEYGAARDELKQEGLCVSGKGRGGSLGRVEGKAPEAKRTKVESLELAREEKKARSRQQREYDELRDIATKWAKDKHDYDVIKPSDVYFYEGRLMVAIWDGPKAKVIPIPQLEEDQVRAEIKFAERNKDGA